LTTPESAPVAWVFFREKPRLCFRDARQRDPTNASLGFKLFQEGPPVWPDFGWPQITQPAKPFRRFFLVARRFTCAAQPPFDLLDGAQIEQMFERLRPHEFVE